MRASYFNEDTIAALASPSGGAVSVVRISGPRSFAILDRITRPGFAAGMPPRQLALALLKAPENGAPLDQAMAVCFPAPRSYTGEDVAELHLHGGNYVAASVLAALVDAGARPALPGEFSFRAVRNGKFSLTQAQAVADLIAASNADAVGLALEKMSGAQNHLVSGIAARLRNLAALSEVGIDFSDQDVEELALPRLQQQAAPITEELTRLHASFARGLRLQDGVRVAFVGLPNAGKSTFFNSLLGEERSIVSEVAGTTRDIVREHLTLRAAGKTVTLRLEDTAGLRGATAEDDAEGSVERIGIARTRQAAGEADLILLIVDPAADPGRLAAEWARLGSPADRTIGISTKSDLPAHAPPSTGWLSVRQWVPVCALQSRGMDAAVEAIVAFCVRKTARQPGEILLTRLDHATAVAAALEHLSRARQTDELDLFASDLRQALHALGPLIGETLADDILGKIFSDFCIGK